MALYSSPNMKHKDKAVYHFCCHPLFISFLLKSLLNVLWKYRILRDDSHMIIVNNVIKKSINYSYISYLFIYLFIYLFTYLFTYLFIYLFHVDKYAKHTC